MTQLDEVVSGDVAEVVSPADLRQVIAHLRTMPSIAVRLVSSGHDTSFDASFVLGLCVDFSDWLHRAAAAVHAEVGAGNWSAWRPEITFTGERRWRMRFADVPGLPIGATVDFDGFQVLAVDPPAVPTPQHAPWQSTAEPS